MLNWLAKNLCLGPLYALCWLAVAALSYNSFGRIDQCLTVCVTPGGPCSLQLSSNVNAFILWRYVHLACSNAARTWPPLVPDRGIGGRDKLLWLEAEPHLDWSSTFGNIYNLKQLAHNYVLAGQINLSNQPGQSEASMHAGGKVFHAIANHSIYQACITSICAISLH